MRSEAALGRRAGIEDGDFSLHGFAEALVALAEFGERPVECADRIGGRKDRQSEAVPLVLKLLEALRVVRHYGRRGALRIAQCVGNAVRGHGIAEEAGIADEDPARPASAMKPARRAAECPEPLDP